jgi:hypothetical protein
LFVRRKPDATYEFDFNTGRMMADDRRDQEQIKKEQRGPRETREELGEEIQPSAVQPKVEHPNRDRARGDWDRTGDHHDEGTSRSEE